VGIPSAVIFASCYEEPSPGRATLTDRLAAIAVEAGMALCCGNGMGFLNIERNLRACGFQEPLGLEAGGIAFVTHSGSAFSAMLHNDRRLRFNLVVSAGSELVTTLDRYVDYALDLESTKAIALFLETVRRPADFRRALTKAAERDVPVVALKVGRTPGAKAMVVAHSGALAGENGAFEAVFDAHGVLSVQSLDEMADTLELVVAGRRAGPGALASIHDSGGERAHLIDSAARVGVALAEISGDTQERLGQILEPGLPAVNPLDAWGTGNDADDIFERCMTILLDDPATAALAFAVDMTTEPLPGSGYLRVAKGAFGATGKPFAVLSNLASAVDRRDAAELRAAGIPVLEGTLTGLAAFKHLFDLRNFRHRRGTATSPPATPGVRDRWRRRLASGGSIDEVEGLALLSDFGIPVVRAERAESAQEALDAARRIGWPVALKTAAPDVAHKALARGVALGIDSESSLRRWYADISGRLGPTVTVAELVTDGIELGLGMVRDAQFGPILMVASGGALIEVLADRRFVLPPLDEIRAAELLSSLEVARHLGPGHIEAAARALVRLSILASEVGDQLDALDVNPLIVSAERCAAADVLAIPRPPMEPAT
jgi:acyl-CoA synthetase (NDP forming)